MKKSLLSRMLFSFALVIGITLLVVGVLASRLFADYYFAAKEMELVRKGEEIARLTADDMVAEWLPLMDRFLDARLFVVNSDGLVLATSTPRAPLGSRLAGMELGGVAGTGIVTARGFSPRFGEPMLLVSVPVISRGETVARLVLNSPVTGLNETVASVQRMVTYAALASMTLSAAAAYWLSKSISDPLKQMSALALNMAHGDFTHMIGISSDDEVGLLGSSLNKLSHDLYATVGDLSREKEKLQDVLQNMSEGLFALNGNGEIILSNPSAEELLRAYDTPDQAGPKTVFHIEPLAYLFSELQTSSVPCNLEFRTGDRHYLAHAAPLTNQNNARGAVIVLQEITRLSLLEALRTDTLAGVSHEIRTPLSSIAAMAESLRDGMVDDPDERQAYLGRICEEAARIARLAADLLELSELQTMNAHAASSVNLESIIRQAMEQIKHNDRYVTLALAEALPIVRANAEHIKRVLLNLLDNAVRFTQPGGTITVCAEARGSVVEVRIEDDGCGIPKDELSKIWERFYRVDKSRARSSGGFGLGLALVKHLVTAYGGTVGVESQIGQGSRFIFTLPAAQ